MLSKITSKLTKTQAELCEGEVTHDEITEAVKADFLSSQKPLAAIFCHRMSMTI